MKKKFMATGLALTAVLTGAAALSACGTDGGALGANDSYGIGAVSTVKLMGKHLSGQAVRTFASVGASAYAEENAPDADPVKRQAEKFNEYFTALDSFLGEDLVTTSTTANTDEHYPFETKMTINGRDFNGDVVTYTMYYTETLIKQSADEKKEETESKYSLEGIMVMDGIEYYLEGKREDETERNESESELEIRAYADKNDRKTYVEMKHEISVEENENETEYVYSVYTDGKLIEETAVEFETERKNNKEETEYELEFRSGEAKGKYKVVREVKNDKTEIKVKYNLDGTSGEFRIREKTDADGNKYYEYTFSDNSVKVI